MRFRHSREGIETTLDRIDYRLTVRFNDHSTVSVLPVGSAVGPMNEGRESSVGTTSDRKARRSTNAGSIPLCGKDFFFSSSSSRSQFSVQTLLRCSYGREVFVNVRSRRV